MTTPAADYEPVHVLTDSALKATIRQAKAEALREAAAIVELINPPESAAPTWSRDRAALVLTDRASRIEAGE